MERQEVIKASGAIHIEHKKITLCQLRLWNVLLANAFTELNNTEYHEIRMQKILEYIDYETKHLDRIKDDIEALVETKVKFNILGKDKQTWGVFTMLAGVVVENGVVKYGYFSELRKFLQNPEIYSRINLMVQNKITSRYGLFLYEFCLDFKGIQQTPFLPLEEFRKLMGIDENEYKEFRDLNKWIIKSAVNEINNKSDILVKVEFKKKRKMVIALKFYVKENPNQPAYLNQLPLPLEPAFLPPEPVEAPLVKPAVLNQDILNQMIGYGVSRTQAEKILEVYSEEKIQMAIAVLKEHKEIVKNAGGFLTKAIKEEWQSKSFDPLQEKKKKQMEIELEQERQRALEQKEQREQNKKQRFAMEAYQRMTFEEKYQNLLNQFLLKNTTYLGFDERNKAVFKTICFNFQNRAITMENFIEKISFEVDDLAKNPL